jgi:hypothetical protein
LADAALLGIFGQFLRGMRRGLAEEGEEACLVVFDVLADPRVVAAGDDKSQAIGRNFHLSHAIDEELEGSQSERDVLLPLVAVNERVREVKRERRRERGRERRGGTGSEKQTPQRPVAADR